MMELKTIQKVDPITQTITISVKNYVQWFDPRLEFNVSDADKCVIGALSPSGKPRVLLEHNDYKPGASKRVWTPDVYVVNKVQDYVR